MTAYNVGDYLNVPFVRVGSKSLEDYAYVTFFRGKGGDIHFKWSDGPNEHNLQVSEYVWHTDKFAPFHHTHTHGTCCLPRLKRCSLPMKSLNSNRPAEIIQSTVQTT